MFPGQRESIHFKKIFSSVRVLISWEIFLFLEASLEIILNLAAGKLMEAGRILAIGKNKNFLYKKLEDKTF